MNQLNIHRVIRITVQSQNYFDPDFRVVRLIAYDREGASFEIVLFGEPDLSIETLLAEDRKG